MEFDFTHMNRTLKKVLGGAGIEQAIKKVNRLVLGKHGHKALMITEVESAPLGTKQNLATQGCM